MANNYLERIKTLTIIALVSDDDLMDRLVLKGGNAMRLIHDLPVRQSLDLDFSLDGDLGPMDEARGKIERLLVETFRPEGFAVFDVKLDKAPPNLKEDVIGDFWGGYTLEFKVLPLHQFEQLAPNKRGIQALELGSGGRRAFTVDLSKHEYCDGKVSREVEGYRVYVYSGLMIACEKVRAICQQMPEYRAVVKSSSQRPRARDFFDIHYLVTTSGVDLSADEAWETLRKVFEVKRVPLRLLGEISAHRDFHRENFAAVRDTVASSVRLESFDFYVDFLIDKLRPLEARWKVDAPAG
ncbi:MAG TPA: nucleotidyl transferase AbiEii/AbiGii toxin family protein [Phycisphaerales bacterium]|nr:nucleotidyl transferase AbiEii/AbiGii toxin family protein [Phycisphaerales bacterium]